MKKNIYRLSLLGCLGFAFMANAQGTDYTKKVGVNTDKPLETLEVNGTFKVNTLPKNAEGKSYNGNAALTKAFTATKTVVADANGVIGYVDGLPSTGGGTNTVGNTTVTFGNKCLTGNGSTFSNYSGVPAESILRIGDYEFGIDIDFSGDGGPDIAVRRVTPGISYLIPKAIGGSAGTPLDASFKTLNGTTKNWEDLLQSIFYASDVHRELLVYGEEATATGTQIAPVFRINMYSTLRTGSPARICYFAEMISNNK